MMETRMIRFTILIGVTAVWVSLADALDDNGLLAPSTVSQGPIHPSGAAPEFQCGYRSPAHWLAEIEAAVTRGEIADPASRHIPPIAPGRGPAGPDEMPCLSPAQIYLFEDTYSILLSDFSEGELIDLMVTAANDLLSVHGDNFDFVGYWVNFTPHHSIGTAFYKFIENDVMGIGDPSTQGTPLFNFRADLGLGGENIEGFVMMWNINNTLWQPGTGSGADFTRLALGQEFEHRFSLFLPDLLDGRVMQGDNASCGRIYHWNWQVDGQGSCMEISEWTGAHPATLEGSFINFNTDIGGIFSYTDLYLMGYVSAGEMDEGNSELRFMDTSSCDSTYDGSISAFSSADIIASAGPRIPDHETEDHHYRTAWIMIHQPGDSPSATELDKAVAILDQHMIDWNVGTLGRGTMNNTVFDDCNCNMIPDSDDISNGTSQDVNGNGIPDECEPCPGDANDDGVVDPLDSGFVLARFGCPVGTGDPNCDIADQNGDGLVDPLDSGFVLARFGDCP